MTNVDSVHPDKMLYLINNLKQSEESLMGTEPKVYSAICHANTSMDLAEELGYNIEPEMRGVIRKTYQEVITDMHEVIEDGKFTNARSMIENYTAFCSRAGVDLTETFKPVFEYIESRQHPHKNPGFLKEDEEIIIGSFETFKGHPHACQDV